MIAAEQHRRPRVGLLYPGHSAEDDFPALERRLAGEILLPLVHTSVGVDHHEVGALLDLGGPDRLAEGARTLRQLEPDSVMWACTSGSFVFGWDGAHAQVDALKSVTGVPTSSTSLAFAHALQHLSIDRVAVAASYPSDVAARFVEFLGRAGVSVTTMTAGNIATAAAVGELAPDAVMGLAAGADTADADALLIPDTAMHTLGIVDRLESAVDLPVLTANQVTVWEGLRLQGALREIPGLGTLFGFRGVE